MADESLTPRDNLYRFIPRTTLGRGRVGVRVSGLDIPGNQQLPPRQTYSDNPVVNRETRDRIINFHVSTINSMRIAKGMLPLSDVDVANITAAAQHTSNPSSESIMQAVLTTASAAMAPDPKQAFKDALAQRGVTEEQYNAALARYGAGLGSLEAAIFAARSLSNSGSELSGNMSIGVGNTGYTGNLGAISMSNYTTAGSQFSATGMTYGTFDYLRNYTLPDGQRFTGTNILHAGQDTKLHGLDTNDRRIARNFATVDHYDGARRQERNRHLTDLAARVAADPEAQRLKREYEGATTEAEKQRIAALALEHGRKMQNESGYSAFVQSGPDQAKKAGAEIGDDVVGRAMGIHARHRADLSAAPSGVTPSGTPAPVAPSAAPTVAANEALRGIVERQAPIAAPLAAATDKIAAAAIATDENDLAAALRGTGTPAPSNAPAATRHADAGSTPTPPADKPKEPVKAATAEPPKEPAAEPVKTATVTPPAAPTQVAKAPPAKVATPKMNA